MRAYQIDIVPHHVECFVAEDLLLAEHVPTIHQVVDGRRVTQQLGVKALNTGEVQSVPTFHVGREGGTSLTILASVVGTIYSHAYHAHFRLQHMSTGFHAAWTATGPSYCTKLAVGSAFGTRLHGLATSYIAGLVVLIATAVLRGRAQRSGSLQVL